MTSLSPGRSAGIRSARRAVLFVELAVAVFATAPASADTAVVPTNFATIQAAVTAVEGTAGALVRIDSDATFTETVTITLSVAIEAGPGFKPTLQGTLVGCDFSGGCGLNFNPTTGGPTSFVVRGLTLVPATGAGSAHRMIQLFNEGSGTATLLGENLVIRDPTDAGAGAFYGRIGPPGTGDNDATFRDLSVRLGGEPQVTTSAFALAEHGALTLERIDLVMTGSSAMGFLALGDSADSVFTLRDSIFDIEGQVDFSSSVGLLGPSVSATIERNRFLLRGPIAPGATSGIRMATNTGGAEGQSLILDANEFVGLGGNLGPALSVAPQPEDASEVLLTNNVIRSMGGGFFFRPQSSNLGGTVSATLVGNTIDRSTGDAISIDARDHTETTIAIYNNLLSRNGGHGVAFTESGGAALATIAFNGFFANVGGDVEAPLTASDSVLGDPAYAADDDLRLRADSPMLDAGTNAAPGLTPLDFAQQPRIQNGVVDIGAYEGGVALSVVEIPALGGAGLAVLAGLLALAAVWRLAARRRRRLGTFIGSVGVAMVVAPLLASALRTQPPGVGLSSVRAQKFGDQVPPAYAAAGFDTERWGYFGQRDSYNAPDEPNDHFGYTLAVDDFDGDRAADLASGHPGETLLAAGEGAATILMGASESGQQVHRYRGFAAGGSSPPLADDYRLTVGSPAIDFGDAGLSSVGPFDLAHASRVAGLETDAGAFEFGALFADGFASGDRGAW